MSDYDGTILFKEWLPDQPEFNNPGLTVATNVEPYGEVYRSFNTITTGGLVVGPGRPLGSFVTDRAGFATLYVGILGGLYASTESGAFTLLSSASTGALTLWDFERYDNLIIATDYQDLPLVHTLGSASNFTTLGSASGTAPSASVVGVIGQFVMLGNTNESANGIVPHRVQWSGIDNPRSWPLPNSATAIAQQAGEQFLDAASGTVTAISSGDQYGLIFQVRAITRATYVGGSVVFQFDRISDLIGCSYSRSVVKVGGLTYFWSTRGIFATDGVSITPIGLGKVDNWVFSQITASPTRVNAAVNPTRNLVYWGFPIDGFPANPIGILIYNYKTNRFSYSTQQNTGLINALDKGGTGTAEISGFGTSFTLGSFSGAPTSAVLTTGETEPNPGGFARMGGIKSLVDQSINGVTAAIGYRNDQSSAVTYTSEITANSRSGFANFRQEARYHRARLTIAGTFNAAQGLEYQATPSGYT